ncbi:MAG: alkaline phosphatase [Nocardioidaceae bacterium]|nr:alkaline phosphatase [Nocardioidaceae bacterium]
MQTISRRGALTAAALSAWPWAAQKSTSASTYAGRLISLPGARTTTTATVSSLVTGGATSISLAYSATATKVGIPTGDVGYVPGIIDADSYVQHTATGLLPDTRYYARLSTSPGVFVGPRIRFRTNAVGAFTRRFVYGSCQNNLKANPVAVGNTDPIQLAWGDMQAYDPDLGWFTGDYGYWGSALKATDPDTRHLGCYEAQTVKFDEMRSAMSQWCWDQMADDHEISGNNGNSGNSMIRQTNIIAMRRFFALHPLADPNEPKRSAYGSYLLNPRIRVVLLDAESMDRTPGEAPDDSAKTFLGPPQDAWLRDLLVQPAALNILICGKSFLGESDTGLDIDKIWCYKTWRQSYADFLSSNLTLDGLPINTVWMGGDRHANGYCSAPNNPYRTGAVWLGSGTSQHSLPLVPGESYDWSYGFSTELRQPVMQYLQGTISDDGAGTITLSGHSREVHDTWDFTNHVQTDPAAWEITDGGSASDTWQYSS